MYKRTTPLDEKSPLEQYVDSLNVTRRLFGQDEIVLPLSRDDFASVLNSIECDLSPENLYCDGECSVADAHGKYNHLQRVLDELQVDTYADEYIDIILNSGLYYKGKLAA